MPFSFPVKDSSFMQFLIGNNGGKAVNLLEKSFGLRIELADGIVNVFESGLKSTNNAVNDGENADHMTSAFWIEDALIRAWQYDDFENAKEIAELVDQSDTWFNFVVSPAEAAIIQTNESMLTRQCGLKAIKAENFGSVSLFGDALVMPEARIKLYEFVNRHQTAVGTGQEQYDNGSNSSSGNELNASSMIIKTTDDIQSASSVVIANQISDMFGFGPCTIGFLIPERAARLIIGRHGHNIDEFERVHRCLIDIRSSEKNAELYVPIEITAKETKCAYDAKEAICKFIDQHISNRDWPKTIDIRCAGFATVTQTLDSLVPISMTANVPQLSPTSDECTLTFSVAIEEAPRLIGIRGINKRRLESRTNTSITLRTEEKADGQFPIDIVAKSMDICERAKEKILLFLQDKPTIHQSVSPRKDNVGRYQPSSPPFYSSPKLLQLKKSTAIGGGGGDSSQSLPSTPMKTRRISAAHAHPGLPFADIEPSHVADNNTLLGCWENNGAEHEDDDHRHHHNIDEGDGADFIDDFYFKTPTKKQPPVDINDNSYVLGNGSFEQSPAYSGIWTMLPLLGTISPTKKNGSADGM